MMEIGAVDLESKAEAKATGGKGKEGVTLL
jgi:hypothetical protein